MNKHLENQDVVFDIISQSQEANVCHKEIEKLVRHFIKKESNTDYLIYLYRAELDAYNGLNKDKGDYFKKVRIQAESI